MSTIQHVPLLSAVTPGNTICITAGDLDYPSRYTHEIYWGPISDYLRDMNAFNYSPPTSSSDLAGESSRGGLGFANQDPGSMQDVNESVLRRLLSVIWQALKTFGKFVNQIGRMNFAGSAWL